MKMKLIICIRCHTIFKEENISNVENRDADGDVCGFCVGGFCEKCKDYTKGYVGRKLTKKEQKEITK